MPSWTGNHQNRKLSGELASLDSRDFQRRILRLLKIVWPYIIECRDLRSWDNAGIDFVVDPENEPISVGVQAKGFIVGESEVGRSQAHQTVKSLSKVAKSGRTFKQFIVIHNRTNKNNDFREPVLAELARLRAMDVTEVTHLWDRTAFLSHIFSHVFAELKSALLHSVPHETRDVPSITIKNVPMRVSELRVDQHRIREVAARQELRGDPASYLADLSDTRYSLLLGEFGFGKTTSLKRLLDLSGDGVVYADGAKLAPNTSGTKHLLFQCIDVDKILGKCDEDCRDDRDKIVQGVIGRIFLDRDSNLQLVIDGLDESAPLSRTGGLQWLFNALRDVLVPVTLSMRTEFWEQRQLDFATSFGLVASNSQKRVSRVRLVELTLWDECHMIILTEREIEGCQSTEGQLHLRFFLDLLKKRAYDTFYGDIPRRPLFLRMLLDTIMENGVEETNLGQLFEQWIVGKIRRDLNAPLLAGGGGRLQLSRDIEGEDDLVERAWRIMLQAASLMSMIVDGRLELNNSSPIDEIIAGVVKPGESFSRIGLCLNTILLPLRRESVTNPLRIRFAHRAFHEYLLARSIVLDPSRTDNVELSDEVARWTRLISSEAQVTQ